MNARFSPDVLVAVALAAWTAACSGGPAALPATGGATSDSVARTGDAFFDSTLDAGMPGGAGFTRHAGCDLTAVPAPFWHSLTRLHDLSKMAIWADQVLPIGFLPLHRRAPGDLFGRASWVGAYELGRVGCRLNARGRQWCASAVADDGTLTPSVVLPGVMLRDEQIKTLQSILTLKSKRPPWVCMCGEMEPHAAFIFYRGDGEPVGEIDVDFIRNRLAFSPGEEVGLQDAAREPLRNLLHELGFPVSYVLGGGCFDTALTEWRRSTPERPGRGAPPGVDLGQKLDELSVGDRRRLCAWNAMFAARYDPERDAETGEHPRRDDNWAGIVGDREEGRFRFVDWRTCVTEFPRCSRTVSEVLPCMVMAQEEDPLFVSQSAQACRPLRGCVWGIETIVSPRRGQ